LFDGLIGKTSAKICGYASIRGIDVHCSSQTFHCSLLDPVLYLFSDCELRELLLAVLKASAAPPVRSRFVADDAALA
jgi:hypothetical protein